MFLTTVRVRQARAKTCEAHGVPWVPHLLEVTVGGKPRAIVTVERSSGRIATVEWAEDGYSTTRIVNVARESVKLMQAAEPSAAAA